LDIVQLSEIIDKATSDAMKPTQQPDCLSTFFKLKIQFTNPRGKKILTNQSDSPIQTLTPIKEKRFHKVTFRTQGDVLSILFSLIVFLWPLRRIFVAKRSRYV